MKIGKKILGAFMAAAMALSLTACSNSPSPQTNYSYIAAYSSSKSAQSSSSSKAAQSSSSSKAAQSSSTNIYSTPPENYFAQSIANQTPTSSSNETPTAKKFDFVGFNLNEAVDILKDAGLGSYIDWESDDGSSIIAKSNWTIIEQRVNGNKVLFICTKTSSGISNSIKAAAQKALNYLTSAEGRAELQALWDGLVKVKGIADTLNEMFS